MCFSEDSRSLASGLDREYKNIRFGSEQCESSNRVRIPKTCTKCYVSEIRTRYACLQGNTFQMFYLS